MVHEVNHKMRETNTKKKQSHTHMRRILVQRWSHNSCDCLVFATPFRPPLALFLVHTSEAVFTTLSVARAVYERTLRGQSYRCDHISGKRDNLTAVRKLIETAVLQIDQKSG